MIFSHKRVKSAFKLKMHVKCIQIRTSFALMNVKEFKFTNRQAITAFGQCFSLRHMLFVLLICLNKLCKLYLCLIHVLKFLIPLTNRRHQSIKKLSVIVSDFVHVNVISILLWNKLKMEEKIGKKRNT